MSAVTDDGGFAAESAIEAYGLGKRHQRGWAIRDCSFRLPAGRVCGLVGPNGAGKTTLECGTTSVVGARVTVYVRNSASCTRH